LEIKLDNLSDAVVEGFRELKGELKGDIQELKGELKDDIRELKDMLMKHLSDK
jgi:hypothetical protein